MSWYWVWACSCTVATCFGCPLTHSSAWQWVNHKISELSSTVQTQWGDPLFLQTLCLLLLRQVTGRVWVRGLQRPSGTSFPSVSIKSCLVSLILNRYGSCLSTLYLSLSCFISIVEIHHSILLKKLILSTILGLAYSIAFKITHIKTYFKFYFLSFILVSCIKLVFLSDYCIVIHTFLQKEKLELREARSWRRPHLQLI